MKLETSVVRVGNGNFMPHSWSNHLGRMGVDEKRIGRLEKEGMSVCYQNIPIVNSLSGTPLSEQERVAISEHAKDEGEPLITVPLCLTSYVATKPAMTELPKVSANIRTQSSPFQKEVTPLYVCKSALLFGKRQLQRLRKRICAAKTLKR